MVTEITRLSGRLYIVGTPIGNLSDISKRTHTILKECHMILAEDTRVTLKLLNHLGLKKRIVSCHQFNELERLIVLDEAIKKDQDIALVCDAGTPLICDPGQKLVQKAIELGMTIIPIPGPSAFLIALIGSGLPSERFAFEGFLPERAAAIKEKLLSLTDETRTLVFYVAPHNLMKTLDVFRDTFGERPACLAKELTKKHEEFIRGTVLTIYDALKTKEIRGEYVLVMGGASHTEKVHTPESHEKVLALVKEELNSGNHVNDIAQGIARRLGLRKSEVYKLIVDYLQETEQDDKL